MNFESPPITEAIPERISRRSEKFGDTAYVEHALEDFDLEDLGEVSEVLGVDPHMNEVRLVNLKLPHTVNSAHFVTLRGDGQELHGIYKPFDGENIEVKEYMGYENLFAREVLCYRISELLGFDLVPPTVMRSVNGVNGSIQLYMPADEYETIKRISESTDTDWRDMLLNNSDFGKMALLDYITAQPDRHMNNIMIRGVKEAKENGKPHDDHELIAIDNGYSLSQRAYEQAEQVSGPHVTLTTEENSEGLPRIVMTGKQTKDPTLFEIPEDEMQLLRNARKEFKNMPIGNLAVFLKHHEIREIEDRIDNLLRSGVYLSRYNFSTAMGY